MNDESYRDILKEVLVKRQKMNTSYSLRAFAKSLDLSSSQLSRVMNGKQGLSQDKAIRVASLLGFSADEARLFCLLVQVSDARSKRLRDSAFLELKKIKMSSGANSTKSLRLEDYEILREWYNIAILELINCSHFSSDPNWIAKEVGITPLLAKESLAKLLKIGVIKTVNGEYRKTQKNLRIDKNAPSQIMQDYYDQLLLKARESIHLQKIDQRKLSSVTVALDQRDIEVLEKKINKFRSEFNNFAENLANQKNKKRTAVYSLATQFFQMNTGGDA